MALGHRIKFFLVAAFFLSPWAPAWAEKPEELCPHWILSHSISPGLNSTEKRLVCGDPDAAHEGREAWQDIPDNQARYFLTNFLQDRGFHSPVFKKNGDSNFVELGPPSRVTSIQAEGAPESLHIDRRRKIIGEPLTPAILSALEAWIIQQLKSEGFGCPEVKSRADPKTGIISVQIKTGPAQNLVSIGEDPVENLVPNLFRRYDAFELGKSFDGDLLTLTETRISSANLVESAHFTTRCEANGVVARQRIIAGPPRLLLFGFGVNTEGLILGRATWRNARLGSTASLIDLTASASTRVQSLNASSNWYFLPDASRTYLNPQILITHDLEDAYEVVSERTSALLSRTADGQSLAWNGGVGPMLDLERTLRGFGPSNSKFLWMGWRGGVKSHDFEFNRSNPRSGFELNLTADLSNREIYSDTTVQNIGLNGEALYNLKSYDPPLLVFGVRGGFSTLFTGDRPGPATLLPPTILKFLGGANDLRGFGRQELTGSGGGALTSGFADFEIRLSHTLPLGFEPFIFDDLGALGLSPGLFDSPLFQSPGFGIRWASPFGVFRTTLAHGYSGDTPNHWQFYLSYGEEF